MAGQSSGVSEKRLASLSEIVGVLEWLPDVGTQLWQPDSDVPRWSDNLFRLLGYEPGEIAPSRNALRDHIHPLDRAERDGRAGVAFRIIRADGEVRHFRSGVRPPADRSWADSGHVLEVIRDVTNLTHLGRAAAAHVAVSNALADWDGLESGGRRLIHGLAEALGSYRGGLWVPRGDVLLARVFWQREPDAGVLEALSVPRLPAGSGVAGAAWEARAPVSVTDSRDPRLQPFRDIVEREGIRGVLAIPALAGDEVLAVLAFVSHEEMPLRDGLMRSLTAIAHDIGRFLDRRRGQLESASLTRRQQEVFALAADGMSSAQIAERLGIRPGTVASHFEHAYAQLKAHNRAAAVARALRLGLID